MQRAVPSPVYYLFGSVFAWLDLLLLQQPLTLHCAFLTLPVGLGPSVLLPAENVVASWQLIPPSETVALGTVVLGSTLGDDCPSVALGGTLGIGCPSVALTGTL